jgi:CBS domain-containing protein
VLLWWKAWDPEGLPQELCVTRPDGVPVAVDPTAPGAAELLRELMHELLSPDGLDADGLKVDFTAQTPSGESLRAHGGAWGIALLHELLRVVYDGAKEAKPDALVITQTPHPAFADVTDMVRLNDMLRLDDPGPIRPETVVPQMRHRAAVAAAALPGRLIDTDDWTVPDRATWREYLEAKQELGVPSLYYATHLDLTGEPLEGRDYAVLRRVLGGVS